MQITVDLAAGQGYCVGQRLYFGGQWLYIKAKFPIAAAGGKITGFNVLPDKSK